MKCKCLCVAVRLVYHCVCIYRCIHLKELTVYCCNNVTDAGISMVTSHCNQLHILDLMGLEYITGLCALCEVTEPILCSIILWCMIFLQQFHHWPQRLITGPYCEPVQYSSYLHNLFSNPPQYSMLQSNTPHHHHHHHHPHLYRYASDRCVSISHYTIGLPALLFPCRMKFRILLLWFSFIIFSILPLFFL